MALGRITAVLFVASATLCAADVPSTGHYSLKLNEVLTPQSQTMGLYLKARIDGGPVLRLLLDSGAQNVVLDRHAALKTGHTTGSAFALVGVGAAPKACRRTAPGTIEIGDLRLPDCEILAAEGQILEGVDGVIPMALFAGFLVRLDVPHRTLELDAFPGNAPRPGDSDLPVRTDNRLFFLKGALNGRETGYVLLDTGATYSAISPAAARATRTSWSLSDAIAMWSSAGAIEGFTLPNGVRFRIGGRDLSADPAVVVDLSDFERHHQFAITGILGYPALRHSVVTMDYRDGLVRIEGK